MISLNNLDFNCSRMTLAASSLVFIFSLIYLGNSALNFFETKSAVSFKGYKPLSVEKSQIPPVFYKDYIKIINSENISLSESRGSLIIASEEKVNYAEFHKSLTAVAMIAPATIVDINNLCIGQDCAPIMSASLSIYQKKVVQK